MRLYQLILYVYLNIVLSRLTVGVYSPGTGFIKMLLNFLNVVPVLFAKPG